MSDNFHFLLRVLLYVWYVYTNLLYLIWKFATSSKGMMARVIIGNIIVLRLKNLTNARNRREKRKNARRFGGTLWRAPRTSKGIRCGRRETPRASFLPKRRRRSSICWTRTTSSHLARKPKPSRASRRNRIENERSVKHNETKSIVEANRQKGMEDWAHHGAELPIDLGWVPIDERVLLQVLIVVGALSKRA